MSVISTMLRRKKAPPKPIDPSRCTVWKMWHYRSEWGYTMKWSDPPTKMDGFAKVVGWIPFQQPCKGDLLYAEMASGHVGVFQFLKVERQSDPRDMFFADMKCLGYLNIGGVQVRFKDYAGITNHKEQLTKKENGE